MAFLSFWHRRTMTKSRRLNLMRGGLVLAILVVASLGAAHIWLRRTDEAWGRTNLQEETRSGQRDRLSLRMSRRSFGHAEVSRVPVPKESIPSAEEEPTGRDGDPDEVEADAHKKAEETPAQRQQRLAAAVMSQIALDLSTPVKPLSPEEAKYLDGDMSAPDNLLLQEDNIQAVLSWELQKGGLIDRRVTGYKSLSAKYCTASRINEALLDLGDGAVSSKKVSEGAACRQYLGRIPDRGSRIGHYFDVWLSTYALALQTNMTFLSHPLLANQKERLLFDRFFGFSYDEPFRFYEACYRGAVGESCESFLPCLKPVIIRPEPTNPNFLNEAFERHRSECNVVYFLTGDKGYPRVITADSYTRAMLRRKFYRARRLLPMHSLFDRDSLNIAIHARRGDIVNTNNAASRWTSDKVYRTVLEAILAVLCQPQTIDKSRVAVHIFSEGEELNKPLLATIAHLVDADILVMAKSGFSTMAAKLREDWQVTLYPSDHWAEHAAVWLPYSNKDGALPEQELTNRVPALLDGRRQWRERFGDVGWIKQTAT